MAVIPFEDPDVPFETRLAVLKVILQTLQLVMKQIQPLQSEF